jgi:molybdopterin-synthase adenylyltransferase
MQHDLDHAELTARNGTLLGPAGQRALRTTRFVVAGCGSTGGACVMPLVRAGAEHFVLLDPGAYELNNLNRQDATRADIGANKAVATAARIRAVNPLASVEVHPDGVRPGSIADLLAPGDFVIDAVDVTTQDGVDAKLALHAAACARRVAVLTAYDIATSQFLELFDYRRLRTPLRGRIGRDRSPSGVLRALIPPTALPRSIFPELIARRADPARPFPQLAMTATLLGALVTPYVLRVLTDRPVRRRVRVDLEDLVGPRPERALDGLRRGAGLLALWWRLRD